jgi:hypothetical protein
MTMHNQGIVSKLRKKAGAQFGNQLTQKMHVQARRFHRSDDPSALRSSGFYIGISDVVTMAATRTLQVTGIHCVVRDCGV